ncbi:hypothetical protein [Micromonospora sp. NPDC023814]|uniref:hypothetical protein n=1 Tax=Micromonospora sp. NPDC023814 TaxID=3154596 RepID=UPI0033DF479F
MDELSRQLHSAVAESPPTRIDVDRLIGDDRQRRRHRAWTLAGAGVAVVVLALTPTLVVGSDDRPLLGVGGSPSAGSSFCPNPPSDGPLPPGSEYETVRALLTERPEDGVARLTGVLRAALDHHLPAGLKIEPALPGCDQIQFRHRRSGAPYSVRVQVTNGSMVEWLEVMLSLRAVDDHDGCGPATVHGSCEERRLPDGSLLAASILPNPTHKGSERRTVRVERTDGTTVTVSADNFPMIMKIKDGPRSLEPAPPPVVTMAQLTAIATTPGFTLYP